MEALARPMGPKLFDNTTTTSHDVDRGDILQFVVIAIFGSVHGSFRDFVRDLPFAIQCFVDRRRSSPGIFLSSEDYLRGTEHPESITRFACRAAVLRGARQERLGQGR